MTDKRTRQMDELPRKFQAEAKRLFEERSRIADLEKELTSHKTAVNEGIMKILDALEIDCIESPSGVATAQTRMTKTIKADLLMLAMVEAGLSKVKAKKVLAESTVESESKPFVTFKTRKGE